MKKISPLLVVLAILVMFSCKKEEKLPDYAGSWAIVYYSLDSVSTGFVNIMVKETYKLEKSSFVYMMDIKYLHDYIPYYEFSGKLSVNNGVMSLIVEEEKYSVRDQNLMINGNMISNIITALPENERTIHLNYAIKNGSLIIYEEDLNLNGTYEIGEYSEYLRLKSGESKEKVLQRVD